MISPVRFGAIEIFLRGNDLRRRKRRTGAAGSRGNSSYNSTMTEQTTHSGNAEVFLSYASADRAQVLSIADQLASAGVSLWLDRKRIEGGEYWDVQIVRAIRACKLVLLACSASALRSRNVKAEIQVAWRHGRPYLPLLLDDSVANGFPEQFAYFLEGWQWVEIKQHPPEVWLLQVARGLTQVGVACPGVTAAALQAAPAVEPTQLDQGLRGLCGVAKFTDLIRPVPFGRASTRSPRPFTRSLGEAPDDLQHGYRLGDSVCLAVDAEADGNLLLLNLGTGGKIYCLCPSLFAPDTRLHRKQTHFLPQPHSPWPAFKIAGATGREQLLAIVTDEPLDLDWTSRDVKCPARVLTEKDVADLLARLRVLGEDRWTALATYFEVAS
jgi:TIR domain/Domain of unknown function (DUF4384)